MITIYLFNILHYMLPPFWRTYKLENFLVPPFNSLQTLSFEFENYFQKKKYELTFNGQVIMLEHLLNDKFDSNSRGIYIEDNEGGTLIYLFNDVELNENIHLFNNSETIPLDDQVFLNNNSEIVGADFIIKIPSYVVFEEAQLKEYVNFYKCASKRYIIEII